MTKLLCGAAHPDPKRTKDTCGSTIMVLPKPLLEVIYVGTVKRIPEDPDGRIYALCPRCKAVNKWIACAPARATAPDEEVARAGMST